MMARSFFNVRRLAAAGVLVFAGLAAACDDSTGPGDDFLIRLPSDNVVSATVVSFTVSPTSPDSIHFEWEAAPGATSYEITFWRAESRDEMRMLRADYSSPAFTFDLPTAEVVRVPFTPDDPEDVRELAVVQKKVAYSEVAQLLTELGAAPGQEVYFTWTVHARKGGKSWRSSETQRMVLKLAQS